MSTLSTTTSTTVNHLALVPGERDQMRIHDIRKFMDANALGLHDTLEAVAGAAGAEVVEDLVGALSVAWPDPVVVARLVRQARDLLAEASYEQIDGVSRGKGRRQLHERVRWYGARLSDLAGAPA